MEKKVGMTDKALAEFLTSKSDEMMLHVSRTTLRELHKDDLSPNRYSILKMLDKGGDERMGCLAENLNVSAPAITTMVDKLEQENYVERVRDVDDRRIVNVRLTAKGSKTLERIREERLKILGYLLARMTAREKDSWAELYEKITSLLREKNARLKRNR